MKLNFLKDIPKADQEKIWVVIAKETTDDYTEGTKTYSYYNPIPILGIVSQLSESQMYWKTAGKAKDVAYEILIDVKYENMIEQSQTITVRNTECYGWKKNSQKCQKKVLDGMLRIRTWRIQ